MCGIAGILQVHPPGAQPPPPEQAIPEAWLDTLDASIRHRGPDGHGRFRDRARRPDGSTVDVALVHRRLAIIDPACGHQPMVSPRGRGGEGLVAVVFNGCIYNHRDLRRELTAAGRRFETDHSDTEVLIHGWREWHEHLPDHLDGMFAAAIWDHRSGRLLMIRDRSGQKPLYEGLTGDGRTLVFASTVPAVLRGLRAAGHSDPEAITDPWMLHEWVRFGAWERPPTSAVHEVQPGDRRVFTGGAVEITTGEPLPTRGREATLSTDDVDRLLGDAVAGHLESDVPLGCFLSGGIDSSLLAAHAKRHLGDLRTFTVRMPDARYDESEVAQRVARHIGTSHQTLDCSLNPADDLTRLVRQLGLPFGDSSLLPAHWVSAATRAHVSVAIGGDGGDELFCGYDRYRANRLLWLHRLISLLPSGSRLERDPKSTRSKLARLASAARGSGYTDLLAIFPSQMFSTLVHGSAPRRFRAEPDAPLHDFAVYLPQDLMRKSDTASMSVALELRSPFLAGEIVERCLSEPLSSLMPHGQRKGLLRQVARKYLPADIVDRPKQGFAIPIGEWFRTDYGGMKQLLLDHLNSAEPWGPPRLGIDLNMNFVRQMLDEHMDRRRDHSQRLYMLLVLSIWAKWLSSLR